MNVENKNLQECNANLVNSACDCALNKKAYIRPHTQIIDFEDIVVCSGGCTTACFEELVDTSNNGTQYEYQDVVDEVYTPVGS